jgi:cobalt-zinc-cadmium efflux system outer membrane protein
MKRVAVLVATVGVFPGVVQADDAAPPIRALLDDPAQLAVWLRERDPIFASARDKVEAASQLEYQTHVLPNPQLQATAGGFVLGPTNVNNGGPGSDVPHLTLADTTNFTFGISELVELGKRGPRQTAAGLRAREAGETAVAALGGRLGDATNALAKLAYVAAKRETLAANAEAARRLAQLEKVRLDKKDLSAAEYARIELDTEQVERALARGEADLAGAIATCSATLYARCAPAGLDAAALDAAAPLPAQLPAPDEAIERRPVREASRLEARALGWDATLAYRRRIPDPTLSVSYMIDNLVQAGNQHQQAIFAVGIPLPAFDRGDHDAAAARANARAIEAEDIAAIREQHGLVQSLLAQRDTLQTTLATLERDAVPKSTQIVAQTRHAFDLGEARLADLLLVERAHRDLLLEVLDTRYDLFNVRAQLRQALGLDDQVARAAGGRTR